VAEEGGGENEVVQPINTNAAANPAANAANTTCNAANNTANTSPMLLVSSSRTLLAMQDRTLELNLHQRKRSSEVYATNPPRPSTFLEGDFHYTLDDVCQFHHDTKHTMWECDQLKRALVIPPNPKKTKNDNNDDQSNNHCYDNRNRRFVRHD
jgi:hypothetical protein